MSGNRTSSCMGTSRLPLCFRSGPQRGNAFLPRFFSRPRVPFSPSRALAFASLLTIAGGLLLPAQAQKAPAPPPPAAAPAEAVLSPLNSSPAAPSQSLSTAGATKARAMAAYFDGLIHAHRREPARALARYLEVLELDPGNLILAQRVAEAYSLAGKPNDSLAVLENALRRNPDVPEAWLFVSDFCYRNHNNSEPVKARAFQLATQAVDRFPGHGGLFKSLIRMHLGESDRPAAAAAVEKAALRDDPHPAWWLSLGHTASQVFPPSSPENIAKVSAFYRKALDLAPKDPATLRAVGDFFSLTGQLAEALPLYQSVVALTPGDLPARERLAHAYSLNGRKDKALETWQELLKINPKDPDVHRALVKYYEKEGDKPKAIFHRSEVIRLTDGDLRQYLQLTREMLDAKLFREALTFLEFAEFNFPGTPDSPRLAAQAHQALGEKQKALAAIERAAAAFTDPASPPDSAFHLEWALAHRAAGHFAEAAAHLKKSIELTPRAHPEQAARAYHELAALWLENNEHLQEAAVLLARALKFEPANPAFLETKKQLKAKEEAVKPASPTK